MQKSGPFPQRIRHLHEGSVNLVASDFGKLGEFGSQGQHPCRAITEPSGAPAKVFIVDDDEAARDSVCALISAMEVPVEAYDSAEDFLASYDGSQAGCLVTDLRMVGISGLELQKNLNRANVRLPVIIISAYVDVETAVTAMKEGAITVLTKPYAEQFLWDAVQHGLKLCEAWRCEEHREAKIRNRLAELRAGEREVLKLITEGQPNKMVAAQLDISIRTVETRRARIMKKLGVDSFAALLHFVHESLEIEDHRATG